MDLLFGVSATMHGGPATSLVSQYIRRNCRRAITLDELAKLAHMNRSYLSERFKADTGVCVSDYLMLCRIEIAMLKLASTDGKIISIGYESGFRSEVTFYRAFRRITGMTPGDYRSARGQC